MPGNDHRRGALPGRHAPRRPRLRLARPPRPPSLEHHHKSRHDLIIFSYWPHDLPKSLNFQLTSQSSSEHTTPTTNNRNLSCPTDAPPPPATAAARRGTAGRPPSIPSPHAAGAIAVPPALPGGGGPSPRLPPATGTRRFNGPSLANPIPTGLSP